MDQGHDVGGLLTSKSKPGVPSGPLSPLNEIKRPPFRSIARPGRAAGPKNKYFEGPLSRESRECRCEIIFSTHRMAQTTKGCERAEEEARGVSGNLVVFLISKLRDEDFAVFDSEWRPRIEMSPRSSIVG